jgi:hypothetical protein
VRGGYDVADDEGAPSFMRSRATADVAGACSLLDAGLVCTGAIRASFFSAIFSMSEVFNNFPM